MKLRKQGKLAVLAVVMSALVLCGCSLDSSAQSVESPVQKDLATWALPSDAYNPPPLSLEYYAVALKAQPCRQAAGLPSQAVRFDPNGPLPATQNAAGRTLFDPAIAAQWGYHRQFDPRINWEDRRRAQEIERTELLTDADVDTFVACGDEAMDALGGDPAVSYQYGFGIDDSAEDPQVKAAADRWRQCMEPLGIAEILPGFNPWEMPTQSLQEQWNMNQDVAPWEIPPASQEEIGVAVVDAQCRDSSGWRQAAYDADWNSEMKFLSRHYKDLEAQRVQWEQLTQSYLDTIAQSPQSGD